MQQRKPTAERRREIADATLKIIGEKGLRQFTTAQIAREVGITEGTIFRHFKDKQEIVTVALERMEELVESWGQPSHPDPLARLEMFFKLRLGHVLAQPGIQALVFSDQLAHAAGPKGAKKVSSIRSRSREFIRTCIAEAAAKKLLREGADPDSVALIVFGAMQALVVLGREGLKAEPQAVAGRVWDTLMRLIRR